MSGFLKTVSSLRQNFNACLLAIAGREVFAVFEKPGGGGGGGLPSRRVGAESPGAWLPAGTKGEARHHSLVGDGGGGGEGHREWLFAH